ncbi:MAG: glycerophosphodiester phosphodiesterase [Lachnospiraceae bacterium]|nr:glycerophosphodiester phosphodiesterase [Lachnospiraceae bacterium]
MDTAIIAHRGASYLAKQENTLEAFQLAIDIGADYVEFDIRQTKDGKLIVFHDNNIKGRPISDITYEEVCDISKKYDFKPPLLSEVLELCRGKIKLDIEIKESGYEQEVIDMVIKYFNYDSFMMKSFLDRCIFKIKHIDPKIKTGLLISCRRGNLKKRFNDLFPERRLKACKADFVSPHYKLASPLFIHLMNLREREIYVWTVNEPKIMDKFLKYEVAGIITDKPDAGIFTRLKYTT